MGEKSATKLEFNLINNCKKYNVRGIENSKINIQKSEAV